MTYGELMSNDESCLDGPLWQPSPLGYRLPQCSPLYIDRYDAPRHAAVMTQHDFWEITAVLSGKGCLHADREYLLEPGVVILMPPHCSHREEAGHLETIWVGIAGELPFLDSPVPLMVVSARLIDKIKELWLLSTRNFGEIGMELDGMMLQIIGMLLRLGHSSERAEPPLEYAVKYLNAHFQEVVAMDELAKRCGMSTGHFFRQFKRFTGRTPVEFLTGLRLRCSMFWLTQTTVNVCRIAEIAGFSDPYYFSRAFRKNVGMSPTEYRRQRELR